MTKGDPLMKKKHNLSPKARFKQYLFLTLGVFIMAVAFYFFVIPSGIVVGGTTGIAMIIQRFIPIIPISVSAFVLNAILLFLALWLIGKKEFVRSLYGSLLFPAFLALFELVFPEIRYPEIDLLLLSLYSGGLIGLGFAIVIHYGGTTGGTDIAIQIVNKYTRFKLGTSIYIVESTIIVVGALTTPEGWSVGLVNMLYAIVIVFLSGKMSDAFLLGAQSKMALNIVTEKPEQLKSAIFASFSRGMTEIDSVGGYTKRPKALLVMVIYHREYHYVTRIIADTDPSAFVYVTPATEVQGEWSPTEEVYLQHDSSPKSQKTQKNL